MNSVICKLFNLLVVILACYSSLYLSGCVLGKSPVSLPCLPTIVTSWQTGSVVITDATDDYSINDEKFKFYRGLSSVWAELIRSFHPMPSQSSKHAATNLSQDFISDVVHFLNSCWMNSDAQAAMISLATWYLSVMTLVGIASRVFSSRPRQPAGRPCRDLRFKIPGPSFYNLRRGPVSASPHPHVSWHRVTYLGLYPIFGVPLGTWWIYSRPTIHPSQFGASSVPWSLATHLLNLIESLSARAIEMSDQLSIQLPLAITKGLGYFVAAAALCLSYLLVFVALSLLMQQPKRKYRLTHARHTFSNVRAGWTVRVMTNWFIRGIKTALRFVCRGILLLLTSWTQFLPPYNTPRISDATLLKGSTIRKCLDTHKTNSDGKNFQVKKIQDQKCQLPQVESSENNTLFELSVQQVHYDETEDTCKGSSEKPSSKARDDAHCQPTKNETAKQTEGLSESPNRQLVDQNQTKLRGQSILILSDLFENCGDDSHPNIEFQQPAPRKSLFRRMDEVQQRLQARQEEQTTVQLEIEDGEKPEAQRRVQEQEETRQALGTNQRAGQNRTDDKNQQTEFQQPSQRKSLFQRMAEAQQRLQARHEGRVDQQQKGRSEGQRHFQQQCLQTATESKVLAQLETKDREKPKDSEQVEEQVQEQKEANEASEIQQRASENSPGDCELQRPSQRKSLFQRMAEAQHRFLQARRERLVHKQPRNHLQQLKVRREGLKHAQQPQGLQRKDEDREQTNLKWQNLNTSGNFRFNTWNHPELPSLDNHITFYAEQKQKEKVAQSLSTSTATSRKDNQRQREAQQRVKLEKQHNDNQHTELNMQDIDKEGCLHFNSWHCRRFPAVINLLTVFHQRYAEHSIDNISKVDAHGKFVQQKLREQQQKQCHNKESTEPEDESQNHSPQGRLQQQEDRHRQLGGLTRQAESKGKTWLQKLAEAQQRQVAKSRHETGTECQWQAAQKYQKKLQEPMAASLVQEEVQQQEDLQQQKLPEVIQKTESRNSAKRQHELTQKSAKEQPEANPDQGDQQELWRASQSPNNQDIKQEIRTRRLSVRFADDASLKETAFIVKNPSSEIVSYSVIKPDSSNSKAESSCHTLKGILADARRQRRSCPRPWIDLPALPGGQRRAQRRAIVAVLDAERCRAWALELEKETRAEAHHQEHYQQPETLKTVGWRQHVQVHDGAFKITGQQLFREEVET
ncbi:trichohyalin-like [Patiria miniata]|uniref:Uncharacterized protein n=1 Tax=Patiria miniata TaxID=46514 RepID=A0A913Z741_PATMI|nr:trichohyalin-like [Patiria miniata]